MRPIIPQTSGNGVLLELLAEFFHSAILGGNATITRRKVYRRRSRVIAEIDLLLEGQGQRFAIECRDRRKPQGLTWIQQIVGKRLFLHDYRIDAWFALSASGFTEDATEFARAAGVELLVPALAEPVDATATGLHELMKFDVRLSNWQFDAELKASIYHNDDNTLDVIERQLTEQSWLAVQIGRTADALKPFQDFVDEVARRQLEVEDRVHGDSDYSKTITITLDNLQGSLSGVGFGVFQMEVPILLSRSTITPDFRSVTFVSLNTKRVFGIVGLSTYERDGERIHMMVHIRPGRPPRLTGTIKDDAGCPVSGATIVFPASLETPLDS